MFVNIKILKYTDLARRIFLVFLIFVLSLTSIVPAGASSDFFSDSNIQFYDPEACDPEDTTATTGDPSSPTGNGKWSLGPGANRPGVELTPLFTKFMDELAKYTSFEPIITTGTNHSQYSSSGNVSDHWAGNAADFGSAANKFGTNNAQPGQSVPRGDGIAAAALTAAGMSSSESKSKAKQGGAINYNGTIDGKSIRVQVIWKSDIGGNHHDHVHVGIRDLSTARLKKDSGNKYAATENKDSVIDSIVKSLTPFPTASAAAPEEADDADELSGDATGSVFILGDSITFGAKDEIKKSFQKVSIDTVISARVSRSLSSPGNSGDANGTPGSYHTGLEQLDVSKKKIKGTGAIIIALGTNKEIQGSFKENVRKAIKKIKAIKPKIKIYWVNVFSSVSHKEDYNNALDALSTELNFTVIDTTNADIEISPTDPQNIHPSPEGNKVFAKTLSDAVERGGDSQPTAAESEVPPGCCPSGAGTPEPGGGGSGQSLGGVGGTGFTQEEVDKAKALASAYPAKSVAEGTYKSTAYGPPWNAMQGTGVTSTGLKLDGPRYEIAVDPNTLPYGSFVYVQPNPHDWDGPFLVADTGGAFLGQGKKLDFYDWRGRAKQYGWGEKSVQVKDAGEVTGESAGAGSTDPESAVCVCSDPSAAAAATGPNPQSLKEFIEKYADSALAAAKSQGIPYDAMLAQIALESGIPLSQLAAKYNNFGGIKFTGEGKSTPPMRTTEVINGVSQTVMARFRAFDTPQEGLTEQAKFFTENSRYKEALKYPRNPERFIEEVAKAGYATDPSYATKVKSMLKQVQSILTSLGKPLSKDVQPDVAPPGGDQSDAAVPTTADCAGSAGSGVVIDGFSFPVGNLKQSEVGANEKMPCTKPEGCHHDGTPAFDLGKAGSNGILGSESQGLPVFAIEDGTIENYNTSYKGVADCPTYQLKGKSGWMYWYGHTEKTSVKEGTKVSAGEKIAQIGPSKCSASAPDTPPHLHIDRGTPKGSPGGSQSSRDKSMIEVINKLWEALPD